MPEQDDLYAFVTAISQMETSLCTNVLIPNNCTSLDNRPFKSEEENLETTVKFIADLTHSGRATIKGLVQTWKYGNLRCGRKGLPSETKEKCAEQVSYSRDVYKIASNISSRADF